MQQKGVVAILLRRDAVLKTTEEVVGWVEAIGPGFGREWRVGDHEVEGLEAALGLFEMWVGDGVVLPDFGGRAVMEDHVHPRQT